MRPLDVFLVILSVLFLSLGFKGIPIEMSSGNITGRVVAIENRSSQFGIGVHDIHIETSGTGSQEFVFCTGTPVEGIISSSVGTNKLVNIKYVDYLDGPVLTCNGNFFFQRSHTIISVSQ